MPDPAQGPQQSTSVNGLMTLADTVAECRKRIIAATIQLNQVALGIHGQRPEPVSGSGAIKGAPSDSLRARIDDLSDSVSGLEQSLGSLLR